MVDARTVRITNHPHDYTGTVPDVIAVRVVGGLTDRGQLTGQAVDAFLGLPRVYDIHTRRPLHT